MKCHVIGCYMSAKYQVYREGTWLCVKHEEEARKKRIPFGKGPGMIYAKELTGQPPTP